MKRKLSLVFVLVFFMVLMLPTISADTTYDNNNGKNNIDLLESGFMIGIMHIKHIKTGWG